MLVPMISHLGILTWVEQLMMVLILLRRQAMIHEISNTLLLR
jgi:hypothetical protein